MTKWSSLIQIKTSLKYFVFCIFSKGLSDSKKLHRNVGGFKSLGIFPMVVV
jgi:hypothetical protein